MEKNAPGGKSTKIAHQGIITKKKHLDSKKYPEASTHKIPLSFNTKKKLF